MTAIIKNVTPNEYNEEMIKFAQTIDFSELFEHVKRFAKVECGFYQPEITTGRSGDVYITFMSDDIASQAGPFAAILKECYLGSFSNGVFRNKETGELGYWVSVSIRYEHIDGGSNGMDMVRAWYSDSKGWTFKDAGNR